VNTVVARELARSYLHRGWVVIPVPHRRKKPGYPGWQKSRFAEDDLVEAFPRDPMNVGVLVGDPSGGLGDVDLDVPLARFLADRFLPRTRAVFGRASARKAHRLYQVTGDAKTQTWEDPTVPPKAEDTRAMLVEFRLSGQTVFPGSTHPTGEAIAWDEEGEPAEVDADDLLPAIGRLAALALAGGLLRAGWPEDAVHRFVEAVVTAAGDNEAEDRLQAVSTTAEAYRAGQPTTGWPRLARLIDGRVVTAVVTWLGIAGPGPAAPGAAENPWTPPTPLPDGPRPPFPADTLPPPIERFVAALSLATQTPPALAALLCLAVLAAAAATRVVVLIRNSWREPVNLYVAVALGPANRKSAVFVECARPLEDFERDETARLAPEIAAKQTELKIKRKRLEALERSAAKAAEEGGDSAGASEQAATLARELAATTIPEPPRLVVDDCSPERLATLLTTQGGRIAALSAEGGIFGMMAGRYSANNEPSLDVYLKGHSGDALRVDRVGRPPDFVRRPALTIGLALQPGVIARLAEKPEFRERGLPARFLFGMPASLVGRRRIAPPPVPDDVRARYEAAVLAVLELPRYVDAHGEPLPKDLVLSPEAEALVQAFEARLEPRLGEGGDLEHVATGRGSSRGRSVASPASPTSRCTAPARRRGTPRSPKRRWRRRYGSGRSS
jgi:hypothetical protein